MHWNPKPGGIQIGIHHRRLSDVVCLSNQLGVSVVKSKLYLGPRDGARRSCLFKAERCKNASCGASFSQARFQIRFPQGWIASLSDSL